MAGKSMTKSEFVNAIADKSGLNRKQVMAVLNAVKTVVVQQLSSRGPGTVTLPGLIKLNVVVKPAQPAREGINPFTKQPMTFKAKPARKVVKARVVKALKDAI